jgi:hypothetical protein
MEPIRPDDDELRADAPLISAGQKKPSSKKYQKSEVGRTLAPGRSKPLKGNGGGVSRKSFALLWLLLVGFACLAVAGWYSQNQRIQALEGQLEEADYWARQSKLALARFEGELSETGENLQQRGASLAEQAATNKKLLDNANSEIRKLWVVANERNKARLDEHQERLTAFEKKFAESDHALVSLRTSAEKVRLSFVADLEALQKQTQLSISALQDANGQVSGQLASLNQRVDGMSQAVEDKLRRFEQEQKLGISGMESRIAALEKSVGDNSDMKVLRSELNSLKNTVKVIDSSRAQLTSRLVRLSEEVNTLRTRQSIQSGQ